MSVVRTILWCACLAALPVLAQRGTAPVASNNNVSLTTPSFARKEQVRSECIAGRRRLCGRVLEVTAAGLVVDSGYPSLLQPPYDHSWLTRANAATPVRPAVLVEGNAPDSIAVGLVFLTDYPKRQKVHQFDYVGLIGYPAGQFDYVPAPGVKKTIRRFAGGLETAVKLTLQTSEH